MFKKIALLCSYLFAAITCMAQSGNGTYDMYVDFNLAKLEGDIAKAINLGEQILPDTAKLQLKTRISFFNGLAKMYEDNEQPDKALPYYEKVAAAVPNYYVAHRALGYLYLQSVREIQTQMDAAKGDKTALLNEYKKAIAKALPHLEKAQACDPDPETLDLIKTLYKNSHNDQGLKTLNERLASLAKNCIDILED